MPMNTATISLEDYDREPTKHKLNIGPLTAANFTAKRAAIDALKAAIPALVLGEIRSSTINEVFTESTAAVTDKNAQRERKWMVTYRDVTQFFDGANTINNPGFGNLSSVELGTADASLLPDTASDELDLTVTAVATYVTAFEAVQNSPTGGNEVEVVSIKMVGRNL